MTAAIDPSLSQVIAGALGRLKAPKAELGPINADVELIYATEPSWPLPARTALSEFRSARGEKRPLRISVLDSSFNPPTKAHLALAASQPSPLPPQTSDRGAYDAHLLLLSVTNADKKLKPGDATYQQRLEMMLLLARELEEARRPTNICVAAIDEPTFVGKSKKLRQAITQGVSLPCVQKATRDEDAITGGEFTLSFVLGFDTVIRLFDPKFYRSKEAMEEALQAFFEPVQKGGHGSSVVCARRSNGSMKRDIISSKPERESTVGAPELELNDEERSFFERPEVAKYWRNGSLSLIGDLDQETRGMSSTLARKVTSLDEASVAGGREAEMRRLLPSSIIEYIDREKLYLEQPSASSGA